MRTTIGRVAELWRYPVKSLAGRMVSEVRCEAAGFADDHCWAVMGADGKLGSGKTTRRFRRMPGLLSLSSYVDQKGVVWIDDVGSQAWRVDDPAAAALLSRTVGEDVTLFSETGRRYYDDAPLHLMSQASIRWLERRRSTDQVDQRRFRPNLVVECGESHPIEDAWLGSRLTIGEATIAVEKRTVRCAMVTLAHDALGFAPGILSELQRASESRLGVYATVADPGTIHVGDPVELWS